MTSCPDDNNPEFGVLELQASAQNRLAAFERLNLALFIHAKLQSVVRRAHIQAHHIMNFFLPDWGRGGVKPALFDIKEHCPTRPFAGIGRRWGERAVMSRASTPIPGAQAGIIGRRVGRPEPTYNLRASLARQFARLTRAVCKARLLRTLPGQRMGPINDSNSPHANECVPGGIGWTRDSSALRRASAFSQRV